MKMLEKLIDKKKKAGAEIDPMEKDVKMKNLKLLRDQMAGMMGDQLKDPAHLKSVQVASNSPEGLAHGLDKAKAMLAGGSDDAADEGSNDDNLGVGADDSSFGDAGISDDAPSVDEGLEAFIGKYLEDPSPENLKALGDAVKSKETEQA